MTAAGEPTVTVLLPVLNGLPYLDTALAALLAQTRPADEVLVLDGGSTDGTRQRIGEEPGVTVIDLPGAGVHASYNVGMARAAGDLIAFTAADDIMDPRALETHVAALAARPDAGYSCGKVALFADPGGVSDLVPDRLAGTVHQARALEAVVVRRRVCREVGGLRDELGTSADVEWIARLGDLGITSVTVDEVVVAKRLHLANSSYTRGDVAQGITRSLRLSILRKRGSS